MYPVAKQIFHLIALQFKQLFRNKFATWQIEIQFSPHHPILNKQTLTIKVNCY
jgi:hypothetical protein